MFPSVEQLYLTEPFTCRSVLVTVIRKSTILWLNDFFAACKVFRMAEFVVV